MEEKVYVEEEIDLRDLFKIIWDKRIFILVFTSVLTVLAIVYVNIKTPIYEAKALIEIGSYKSYQDGKLEFLSLDDENELSKRLSTIFIDLRKNEKNKEFEITKINVSKGTKNFIEISSEAISNDLAIKTINDLVDYTKNIHIKTLNDVKEKNDVEMKTINLLISNIQNDKIINIDKKIELYNKNIVNLKEQMNSVSETLKNTNNLDSSIGTLKMMEKKDISNEIIQKETSLYDLIEEKENLINIDLNKLLERKKMLEILSLPHNFKNTEVIGNILTDEDPIKPKKIFLIVFTILGALVLSIFIILIQFFTSNLTKEIK